MLASRQHTMELFCNSKELHKLTGTKGFCAQAHVILLHDATATHHDFDKNNIITNKVATVH